MRSERLAELAATKLRALVGEHTGESDLRPAPFGSGATLRTNGSGWVYLPDSRRGALGAAVAWAARNSITDLNVVHDDNASWFAYCAQGYDPTPTVWATVGRSLVSAEPVSPIVPAPPPCESFVSLLDRSGLDVVADHGVWIGDINGLEVARVGERDGECAIDIGVGAHDQFAAASLLDDDPGAHLRKVVDMVGPYRTAGADAHPLGRLVRSRWLRAQCRREPGSIGLATVDPVPLLVPRPGLNEAQPAAALGTDTTAADGRSGPNTVVVFSVGIDPGLTETVAALTLYHRAARALVVVPPRDRHPSLVESAGRLRAATTVVTVEGEWSG